MAIPMTDEDNIKLSGTQGRPRKRARPRKLLPHGPDLLSSYRSLVAAPLAAWQRASPSFRAPSRPTLLYLDTPRQTRPPVESTTCLEPKTTSVGPSATPVATNIDCMANTTLREVTNTPSTMEDRCLFAAFADSRSMSTFCKVRALAKPAPSLAASRKQHEARKEASAGLGRLGGSRRARSGVRAKQTEKCYTCVGKEQETFGLQGGLSAPSAPCTDHIVPRNPPKFQGRAACSRRPLPGKRPSRPRQSTD